MANKYNVVERGAWKAEEFDGRKPTAYDWARMAAFLDGEGSVQVNPARTRYGKANYEVRILVSNTNANLPKWILETFGGNVVVRDHKNPKWKLQFVWSCAAGRAAWILWNCLPWFLLKEAQARLLIELQENKDRTRLGRRERMSEETMQFRAGIHEAVKSLNSKGPKLLKEEVEPLSKLE